MYSPWRSEMPQYFRMAGSHPGIASELTLYEDALDAYIYGFPLVLMDITRRKGLVSIPEYNRFYNQKVLSTPKFSQVVRPNVDTLYSSAWLDLSHGPLQLHVPDTDGRYYLLPMLDAYSNVFASVGARTTGTKEQTFVIVGPGWQGALPLHVPVIHAPTNTVWITGRTQTNGTVDYDAAHAVQRGYKLTRLTSPEIPHAADQLILSDQSPKEWVASMDAAAFFELMMQLMWKNPPYPAIQSPEMTRKLEALGLVPSSDFSFRSLHPEVQQALIYANHTGLKVIQAAGQRILNQNRYNGWNMLLKNIGSYGTDYMQRAFVANTLFGANIPQDAVYAYLFDDPNGNPLDGSRSYQVHFKPGQMPPVNAFWSITMYNAYGFLVENPIHRYAVSPHLEPLQYNADGSLDIWIQRTSPEETKKSNWLPSPTGPFNLMLRMYWPQQPVLQGQWFPPGIA